MTHTLIAVENLSKNFPQAEDTLRVLDRISFTVERGGFTTIIGPSGCGKSTLLNILTGLVPPSGGGIRFFKPGGGKVEFGYVFQAARLLPWKKVIDNVRFVHNSAHDPEEVERNALHYLELVGLKGVFHHYPHQLSGGMQQRVGIARALSLEPDILLMDEPFSHLDEITAKRIRADLIRIWQETGVTIFFVTHDLVEAAVLSDRVIMMTRKPARIFEDVRIDFSRPRNIQDPRFLDVQMKLARQFAEMEGEIEGGEPETSGQG